MRETWFIKNVHTRELTISDLDKAPAIRPNETVDMLRYHTKQEIEQSESLAAAIAANAVLGLVEPTGNGMGGDLFAIIWDAKTSKLYGLNASGRSPKSLSYDYFLEKGS